VREAMQSERGSLFIASPCATKLEEVSASAYHAAPDEIARLGFAVAHELNTDAPAVTDLPDDLKVLTREIANALKSAERPLVVSGAGCGSKAVIQAAANIASALCADGRTSSLCFTMAECNTLGIGLMGGGSLEDAMAKVYEGNADTAIILENDLFRRLDEASTEKFLSECTHVIAIDHLQNSTTSRAEVVLSSSTFAESGGTLVNNEGRAQRFFPVCVPDVDVMESWRWLLSMLSMTGRPEAREWMRIDDITAALSAAYPVFAHVKDAAPPADFRVSGKKIPRQPHRYSGRTALTADVSVHEPKPPGDDDSPFSFSMEGYEGIPPSALIPRFWAPGWNSVQSVNKFQQEVGGPLIGGNPGQRLIEPPEGATGNFFSDVPGAFSPREGEWLLIPLYHIFGSEELSLHADGISELSPQPYLALNAGDAAKLGLSEGDEVELSLHRGPGCILPLRIVLSLPEGIAAIPAGLSGLTGIDLPSAARIVPVKKGDG
jgi:NADH-quinone oxidoreductase subunit G